MFCLKGLAVDNFRTRPKYVLGRLDNQVSVPLPVPVCSDSHAMRTDVVCRGRLCEQRLHHTREIARGPTSFALTVEIRPEHSVGELISIYVRPARPVILGKQRLKLLRACLRCRSRTIDPVKSDVELVPAGIAGDFDPRVMRWRVYLMLVLFDRKWA